MYKTNSKKKITKDTGLGNKMTQIKDIKKIIDSICCSYIVKLLSSLRYMITQAEYTCTLYTCSPQYVKYI